MARPHARPAAGPVRRRPAHLHLPRARHRRRLLPQAPAPQPPPGLTDPAAPAPGRGFATAKDPASTTISRGWCRLMGLAPLMLFTAALLAVRNQRILEHPAGRKRPPRRPGPPPKTRKRRRKTLASLAAR